MSSPLHTNSRSLRQLVCTLEQSHFRSSQALSTVLFRVKAGAPDVALARAAPLPLPACPGSLGERTARVPVALPLLRIVHMARGSWGHPAAELGVQRRGERGDQGAS